MTEKAMVSLRSCSTYDSNEVYDAVRSLIDDLGGIAKFIKKGMVVALKPNLLLPLGPDNSATSHPEVVGAIGRLVKEAGAIPIIVESPGGPYTKVTLRTIYKACGMTEICNRYGIDMNFDISTVSVTTDAYGRTRSFNILKPLAEADFVINIPKLKTHGMMTYTGAVKNMFGAIAGTEKATHHMNVPDYDAFASNMIDICIAADPNLTVMDSIEAMEGNGPSAGKTRKLGLLLASESPFSIDMAAHDIINLKIEESYILSQAVNRGIPIGYESVGDSIDEFKVLDFDIPYRKGNGFRKRNLLNSKILTSIKSKPVVNKNICIGCAVCKKNCPAEVITMVNRKPEFDYKGCIRCFCCQELCPEHAISIKEPIIIKMLKLGRKSR
jgi:uncharacterized protein (DUF362 family)/Pyruvate/2-oxoacid:ferredoxin oxidoreductase delta subunit